MKTGILLLVVTAWFIGGRQTHRSNDTENDKSLNLIEYPVSVGLGLLEISFDSPVPLYRTENDTEPFDTLAFRKDTGGVWHYETKHLKSWKPYGIYGGDSDETASERINTGLVRLPPELAFRVLAANSSTYCVVIDEESFATAVIRKNPGYAVWPQRGGLFGTEAPDAGNHKGYYAFETWEHLLKRAEFVDFGQTGYAVYDAPGGKKIFENTRPDFLPYTVTEVCGDWMKVKKGHGREFNFNGIENAEGWVKWKDDTRILVDITEYTLE